MLKNVVLIVLISLIKWATTETCALLQRKNISASGIVCAITSQMSTKNINILDPDVITNIVGSIPQWHKSYVLCCQMCSLYKASNECVGFNFWKNSRICQLIFQTPFQFFYDEACVFTETRVERPGLTTAFTTATKLTTLFPPLISSFINIANSCTNPFAILTGWKVIQRRCSGAVDFYRTFSDYKSGFGDLNGEFWIGNEYLYQLTASGARQLRVDIKDSSGIQKYALYSTFRVGPASDFYRLSIGGYSGTSGDSLTFSNGALFSTYDVNNVNNCAVAYHTGMWLHPTCSLANPNGVYGSSVAWGGVNWYNLNNCYTCTYPYFQISVY